MDHYRHEAKLSYDAHLLPYLDGLLRRASPVVDLTETLVPLRLRGPVADGMRDGGGDEAAMPMTGITTVVDAWASLTGSPSSSREITMKQKLWTGPRPEYKPKTSHKTHTDYSVRWITRLVCR